MALDVSRLKAMTEGYSSLEHQPGNSVLEIALDKIERDESQPRKNFDEDTLRDLAESIEAYGRAGPLHHRGGRTSVPSVTAAQSPHDQGCAA